MVASLLQRDTRRLFEALVRHDPDALYLPLLRWSRLPLPSPPAGCAPIHLAPLAASSREVELYEANARHLLGVLEKDADSGKAE